MARQARTQPHSNPTLTGRDLETLVHSTNLDGLRDMDVELAVEMGRAKLTLDQALDLAEHSIIDLNRLVGEPVDVRLNGKLFARGEIVTVAENFGVRIKEVLANPPQNA